MGGTFGKGLALVAAVVVALLVLNAGLTYRNTRQLDEDAGWVAHTHQVLDALAEVRSSLREAEAAQRTYLFTNAPGHLDTFRNRGRAASAAIDRMQQLTEDNPDQRRRIPKLRHAVSGLLDYWQKVADVRHRQGPEAARRLIGSADEVKARETLQTVLGKMQGQERDLLRDRQQATESTYRAAVLTGLVTAVLGLVGVITFAWLVGRTLSARLKAAAVIQRERERFRVTLASIGDAVIVTDARGRITFLNPVAEQLTGWNAEAIGRDLSDVFVIVNEQTGAAVESPVSKVIREGAVVGLANHTVLIARDGSRRPIDDSGAPVRGSEGAVAGVVLVFRDVSERRRAETELRQSVEQFHTLADSIPQLAWMARPDGHIFWYNRRWYEYTGTTPEAMEGWGWQSVHDAAELPRVVANWRAALASGEAWEDTFPLRRHDGQMRWHLSRALPVKDQEGRVVRWFGTNTDITERLHMEEALREADRRKDEFLATLAHELRNPLAPIRTALEIMRLAGDDGEAREQARAMMERQLRQVVRLVDDLLDVSRITRGRLVLQQERVELAAVLKDALETCRPQMTAGGHELDVTLPPHPVYLDADKTRLAQVFANLLGNAAKYTPRGGRVALTAAREGDEAVVTVKDTGVGIPADMLHRIFDMFTQVDRTLGQSQGGLGVGLTLVKRLVEMHGGGVVVRSEGVGQGSEFVVRLPVARADAEGRPQAGSDGPAPAAARRRILVADDNADAAESLAAMLRLLGHEVATVHDGLQAVETVAASQPEVVLLDIGMPQMNGYDAARRIREGPGGKGLVLVALTGWGQEEDKRRAQEAGFDHHLTKPVDPAHLQTLLAGWGK